MTADTQGQPPPGRGPLAGIRVLEVGMWVAAPATTAMMADWGADVIKVEPLSGEPVRGWTPVHDADLGDANPVFDQDNRGKRSIALDLAQPRGQEVALDLVRRADVLVTNMRQRALDKLGLDYGSARGVNPRLVYCQITSFGMDSIDRDRASFDIGAFWSSTGLADGLSPPGEPPAIQRPGIGDHSTAVAAVAGTCAALVRRARTGEGEHVVTSLYRAGGYAMSLDLNCLANGVDITHSDRRHPLNPLLNAYQTADGRWVWLLLLQSDRQWPAICAALDVEELAGDPRFASFQGRGENAAELVEILDRQIGSFSLDALAAALDRHGVWWNPVHPIRGVLDDPVAGTAGLVTDVPDAPPGRSRVIAAPVDFRNDPWAIRSLAPLSGQHTEEILLECGYDWPEVSSLNERGVIL